MAAPAPGAPSPVELWHRRMFVFSVTATLALVVEIGYAQLVPKIPQLYAALLRAAVWDCVLVGVLVAQLVDLASTPLLVGTDGGHYLPLVVLLYHSMKLLFCAAYDGLSRSGVGRSRSWHRSLVCRRVLLELAGGTTGRKLYLGRVCFVVSGGAMWLALRALLFLDDGMVVLSCFIVLLLAAYCAAGLAALEPRHSLPGRLVQWLCTGWGAREALVQGPLKIFGGLFLLPFAASVVAAQIWLRTVAFIVWLAMACPCCRLQRGDNVYDAFERELAVPLLQCSFLAFACTLAAVVLVSGQLSGTQRTAVGLAAAYYTGMLMLWTAPTVLQAKVANEEAFDTAAALGDEGNMQLLQGSRRLEAESDIELEDVKSACDELRALLQRERHDHSVEAGQLQERLRDQEVQTRALDRELAATKETSMRLNKEIEDWRERCSELKRQLALQQPRPELPRLRWPLVLADGVPAEASPGGGHVTGAEAAAVGQSPRRRLSGHGSSQGRSTSSDDSENDTSNSGVCSTAPAVGARTVTLPEELYSEEPAGEQHANASGQELYAEETLVEQANISEDPTIGRGMAAEDGVEGGLSAEEDRQEALLLPLAGAADAGAEEPPPTLEPAASNGAMLEETECASISEDPTIGRGMAAEDSVEGGLGAEEDRQEALLLPLAGAADAGAEEPPPTVEPAASNDAMLEETEGASTKPCEEVLQENSVP